VNADDLRVRKVIPSAAADASRFRARGMRGGWWALGQRGPSALFSLGFSTYFSDLQGNVMPANIFLITFLLSPDCRRRHCYGTANRHPRVRPSTGGEVMRYSDQAILRRVWTQTVCIHWQTCSFSVLINIGLAVGVRNIHDKLTPFPDRES